MVCMTSLYPLHFFIARQVFFHGSAAIPGIGDSLGVGRTKCKRVEILQALVAGARSCRAFRQAVVHCRSYPLQRYSIGFVRKITSEKQRNWAQNQEPTYQIVVLYTLVDKEIVDNDTLAVEMLVGRPDTLDEEEVTTYVPGVGGTQAETGQPYVQTPAHPDAVG